MAPYYHEAGLDGAATAPSPQRKSFDDSLCSLIEEIQPKVVSFHFGLPEEALVRRVKATGARVLASATTVAEARWLAEHGADAIIAQGCEAGGHRGIFLGDDITTQPGVMALVPQVVDAVRMPVIAAGGIADGRGIAAAFALGAAGVQIGTAYLFTPQATITPIHRAALDEAADDRTVITNIFSGRPARSLINRIISEIGPMAPEAPPFPAASAALAPLKAAAEKVERGDFSSLWSGQAARLGRHLDAGELTRSLALEADQRLALMAGI